jgi:ribosome maturation factor RimP
LEVGKLAKAKVADIVRQLVMPILEDNGFELVDIEFKKEGAEQYLRIFIDKPDGITIDDCELISRHLSDKLDEEDPIPQAYILEVSSPGIDRPLKTQRDFERNMGKQVEIRLYKQFMGHKAYKGTLVGFDDERVEIETVDNQRLSFGISDIALIKPIIEF